METECTPTVAVAQEASQGSLQAVVSPLEDLARQPHPRVDRGFPRAWDGRIAFVLTMLLSPPVVSIVAMSWMGKTFARQDAWLWVVLHTLLAILVPVGHIAWLVSRGKVTDIDVQLREQRTGPMLVTMACTGLAWMVLWLGGAPGPMVLLAGVLCLQTCIIFVITLRWKISVHCAAAAGSATVISAILGTPLPFVIGVPIVAWSRVRLSRHTLAQTVAGSALGLSMSIAALLWMR